MIHDEQWLNLLNETTEVAAEIKNLIPGMGLWYSDDENFFRYSFLDRLVNIGKSVATLTEKGLYHEAGVAARTAVEGELYFEAYKRDQPLARLFHLFWVYEGYDESYRAALWRENKRQRENNLDDQTAANAVAKAAADKWLDDFKKISPAHKSYAEEAEQEIEFGKRKLKWHEKSLGELVKSIKPIEQEDGDNDSQNSDEELEDLVEFVSRDDTWGDLHYFTYHAFSQVAHWTPIGVVGWEYASNNINGALTATIHCLLTVAVYVNDKCKLPYDNDLIRIEERYEQKGAETLRNLKEQK
jgi:hypothetical protein